MTPLYDAQLRALMTAARQQGAPDLADLPLPAARGYYAQLCSQASARCEQVSIQCLRIPGPGGELELRVYRPSLDAAAFPAAPVPGLPPAAGTGQSLQAPGLPGLVLYLHGGGFALGQARDYDGVCSVLAQQSAAIVVQVDYRLAPEHPFPAAVEDSYAALCWLGHHGHELGADPARMAVAGDSAGGNLAAVVALLARDRRGPALACQVLVYPVTAPVPEMFDSYRHHGDSPTLTTRAAWHFTEWYLGGRQPVTDFRAAPLLAGDLADLPPAVVLVAGLDPLRDEGVAYAARLLEAGTPAVVIEYPGLLHGFLTMAGAVHAARLALDQVANALGRALVPGQSG